MIPPPPPNAAPPPPPASVSYDKLYMVRAWTWFCALVEFSVIASIDTNGYSKNDGQKFAITMGVFLWLYNMVLLANYVGANYAHREIMPVDMVESKYAKPIDIFLLFMFYTATICISEDSSTYCKAISDSTCSKLSAGATFGWFGSFGIVGSIFLREPAAFTRLVKGLKDESYADIVGPTGSISTGAAPTEQAPQKVVDL